MTDDEASEEFAFSSAKSSPVWSQLGAPYQTPDGQWRAAYAHGHSVPLSEAERIELQQRGAAPLAPVVPIAPAQQCASCGSMHTHEERFKLEAHNEGCMQPEIRFKRAEARIAHLLQVVEQLVGANNDSVTNVLDLNKRLGELKQENLELRVSILALARHMLTPGECLNPDLGIGCGGCDLCPCRTDGHFHGTCDLDKGLVKLLQEDILEQRKRGVALPWWARLEAKERNGTSEATPDTQRSRSVYLGSGYSLYPGDPGQPEAAHTSEPCSDAGTAKPAGEADAGSDSPDP